MIQSVSSTDLSLSNLTPPAQNSTPIQTIYPKEKVNKSKNRFLQIFLDYLDYLKMALITFLIAGLKASGPIPNHVAIIMDGNRRYARKKGFTHVSEGHFEGAKTLEKVKSTFRYWAQACSYWIMDSDWESKVLLFMHLVLKILKDLKRKLRF